MQKAADVNLPPFYSRRYLLDLVKSIYKFTYGHNDHKSI